MAKTGKSIRSAVVISAAAAGVVAAPQVTEASFGEEDLSFGMQGEHVKTLQNLLQKEGFFGGFDTPGVFGEVTRSAVQQFQANHMLLPDGVAGAKTFSILNTLPEESLATEEAEDTYASESVSVSITPISDESQVLRKGVRSSDVESLQQYLQKAGFYDHPEVTGIYGNMTKEAVRQFQQARELKTDGLAGPETLGQMNQEIGSNVDQATSMSRSSLEGSVLRQGDRGSKVESLQEELKELGHYTSTVDGIYGPLTASAVRDLQRETNITVDGIFGPQTFSKLGNTSGGNSNSSSSNDSSASSSSGNSSLSGVVLRQGARGDNVRTLQDELKDLGYYTGSIDGIYGPMTASAVRGLQRATGISVDGIFGPQTYGELSGAPSSSGGSSSNNSSSDSSASSGSSSGDVLKVGSRGADVRELQEMLRATGHYSSGVDGIFGPLTKSAVSKFQNQWDMTSDGIATQRTVEKLEEVSAVHMSESTSSSGSSSGSFNATNLIADASEHLGVPYKWGGTTPSGFDCSGFIQYVFNQNGVDLPRTAAQQWNAGTTVSSPRVGDVVFFETYRSGPSHNGIYIGNNQFIHAGSSTGVTVANMNSSYWSSRYLGAKRLH
ncbi:peptidoglycan-binding protein [Salisediminibacterium halotolerans]|uniref:C40 family peptidase n=1 Tax=Salisediminibacterium halotolerans TaxID=517425 RepID=UPI000EB06516|nr:peptidoglycan-binding protein [Salisediminibacterium halotolerans]RLJ75610.1 cell wall-associated NlpC family hydrolase [Actinophytocola xinjiangensis]RPE89464.1 cell wall-associated NlpC family hydrolase [Salisediminibacterium halotolerans]TWG36223.1 cell wall-associated NlpC family hydrolase [Salisediminibacterium halotolerans]GEL08502.1 hypothetical protein SHA02_19180 [Salisediminibacterium halotolerans]